MTAPTIEPKHAKDLAAGAWTARWAQWLVDVRFERTGWRAIVKHWPEGSPGRRLDEIHGCTSPLEAVTWACRVLTREGAKAFVDGKDRPLVDFLRFTPAPALCVHMDETP